MIKGRYRRSTPIPSRSKFRRWKRRRWISALRPSNSWRGLRKTKTPKLSLRGFSFACFRRPSALRVTRHEVVVTDFGDLEPLVAVVGKVGQRFIDLLEIGIARSNLAVQFLRRPQGGLHDRRREGMQFRAVREQPAQCRGI